jgi:hypothetical protein
MDELNDGTINNEPAPGSRKDFLILQNGCDVLPFGALKPIKQTPIT